MRHLKVVAEAEFQRLGGELEVALHEMYLSHEEMGISMSRVLIQTMLQTAVGRLHVSCRRTTQLSWVMTSLFSGLIS